MKTLKQIIFVFAVSMGLVLGVSAQTDDQKKPPKGNPPVIKPGEKPPREIPPKGEDRPPKKPGMSFYLVSADRKGDTV